MDTIIPRSGQDRQDPPTTGGQPPDECASFIQLAPPAPDDSGGVCARCGRPDFAHPADGGERQARLEGLDAARLATALTWLAGYRPAIFDAALDAAEPSAGEGEPGNAYDPEPFCTVCGSQVGIFLLHGSDWRHFRGTPGSKLDLFDPGHRPVIGWRPATVTVVTKYAK